MKLKAVPIKTMVIFEYAPEPLDFSIDRKAEPKPPVPCKFKIKEDGKEIVVVIGSVLDCRKEKKSGIESWIYQCQSIIHGIQKRYELKYIPARCEWLLHKKW